MNTVPGICEIFMRVFFYIRGLVKFIMCRLCDYIVIHTVSANI